jgi:hypothetical protein
MTTIASCNEGKTQNAPDEGSQATGETSENCFSQLHPGKVGDGKLEGVIFQNGACIGQYKALNKFAMKEEVRVLPEGADIEEQGTASALYLDGAEVYVKLGGRKVAIGTLMQKNEQVKLDLKEGIRFELRVEEENGLKFWQYGDPMRAMGNEEIVLFVP